MKKQLNVSQQGTVHFSYVKNSPFYKDKVTYGVFITKSSTIDFTSTSFIVNFAKSIIKLEWRHTKKSKN